MAHRDLPTLAAAIFTHLPANISGLHRVRRYRDFFDMIAFGAVERAKFESCRPRRNMSKPHTNLAFWAAESSSGDCGWVIGHCIPPLGQAGSAKLAVTGGCQSGPVMEPACASEFGSRWSKLLTFADLNGGG